jgi:hypothetical protein
MSICSTAAPDPKNAPALAILDPQWNGRSTFKVPEVARILGLSPAAAWAAANSGKIGHVRVGRRIIIPRHVVERLLSAA